jgi:hypothetical protein
MPAKDDDVAINAETSSDSDSDIDNLYLNHKDATLSSIQGDDDENMLMDD